MDDRLSFATIRELGRMIRAGETTPTALAEHFIQRLETVGRELHAVVTITAERALSEARLAEEELAAGVDRGPLHGIPYGAKDLLATAGIPTSWGAVPLREQVFDHDATVIQRLREAGAVLVAKVAMIELAGGMGYRQPNASLTGAPRNPWNRNAWTGGSSSGSGATVAAGAVPFAIGSETGGSILSPSASCAVTGLRPTYGRISRAGAMALSWTLDKLGPMCRTADDCGLVLQAVAGYDPNDPTTLVAPYRYDPALLRTEGFRLGVVREGLDAAQPEVAANYEATVELLSGLGLIEEVVPPELPTWETYQIVLACEGAAAFEDLLEQGLTSQLTAPEDRLGGYPGSVVPAVDYLRALRVRRKIADVWDALLARYDGVLFPSMPSVAGPIEGPLSYSTMARRRVGLTTVGNLIGAPAISVPNGFGERELPTAVQVMGRTGGENAVIAVASAYQARTGWHAQHPNC